MGSRLGVIVKNVSGWEIYYDHWAAQSIGVDIALDGFEATLRRVRRMTPMGIDTPQEWTGATWIEGTLLIDLTTQTVTWAEESEGLYLPRLINALTERTWPGWTAVWSSEGTRGVLAAVGVDPGTLFTSTGCTTMSPDYSAESLVEGGVNDFDMLSVALEGGRIVQWWAGGFLEDVACLGPSGVRHVALKMLERSAEGECLVRGGHADDERPTMGIHIDYGTRTLRWWSLMDEGFGQEEFAALWPGWLVESMGDNYEWHENIIGRELRGWQEDVVECREQFIRDIAQGARPNPMLSAAGHLVKMGHDIRINSCTLQFVPADRSAGSTAVLDLLDDLASSAPLPPARYIDRCGVIHAPDRR